MMEIRITPLARVEKDYPWKTGSWSASAESSLNLIGAVVRDLGLGKLLSDTIPPMGIMPTRAHRLSSGKALASVAQAVKNWLKGIEVVEEDATIITRQVPLCLFNSPDVPGAKTTYGEIVTQEGNLGWKIEVLGTGFGADVTVVVKNKSEFVSSSGDRKLVFAPLKMRVVKVSLYKRGVFQKTFLKAELDETEVRDANGLRTISPDEWQEFTSGADVFHETNIGT